MTTQIGFLDAEDRNDVGMVDGGDRLRFTLKALKSFGIRGDIVRQHDGDLASKLRVLGSIDLTHAAAPRGERIS